MALLPFKYGERNISSNDIVQILNSPHRKGDLNLVKGAFILEHYTNDLKKKRKEKKSDNSQKESEIKKKSVNLRINK